MMSRRASFDIFQGNASIFLFRDVFGPHPPDSGHADRSDAPMPDAGPMLECRWMVTPTGIEPVFQP